MISVMRITFIAPEIGISGGIKAIFEFANHLHELGHDVSVVYPLRPMRSGAKWYNVRNLANRTIGTIANFKRDARVEWFDFKANLIRVPTFAERYIPDADIVVATWWATAYHVSKYSDSKGEKFYLAQHYEIWGGPEEEVNNSYMLGLRIIVNSTWLKNILQDKFDVKIEALILHAPDQEKFYPENVERSDDTIRILMPYRKLEWKGDKYGIKVFEIVREKHPEVQFVMFGPAIGEDVPEYVEFHENPSNDELRRIYNSCDIFLFPSLTEGFGMPPMEAMVCKCAVVTTNVGAVPEYTIPGKNALVSPPGDADSLAQNIIKLIENDEERKRMAENGYNHIKPFTWAKATAQLEEVFKRYV